MMRMRRSAFAERQTAAIDLGERFAAGAADHSLNVPVDPAAESGIVGLDVEFKIEGGCGRG